MNNLNKSKSSHKQSSSTESGKQGHLSFLDKLYLNSIEYLINFKKHFKEYAIAIMIVLLIRSTIGVVYQIPTGSMIPTFMIGDTLLANRFYYGLKIPFTDGVPGLRLPPIKELGIGDIVIFRGPQEKRFLDFSIDYTPANEALLRRLNDASQNKGLADITDFGVFSSPTPNYIILSRYPLYSENNNSANDVVNELEIRLSEEMYLQYQSELTSLRPRNFREHTMVMSYRYHKEYSFFAQLINTPLSGVSMILTVLARSPYLYAYANLLKEWYPNLSDSTGEFSFYPNRYLDTTKEYVKRVIAKGGDSVEIRNKEVLVNGEKLTWATQYQVDKDNEQFFITVEDLPHSPKSTERMFTHPIRFSRSIIRPTSPFPQDTWPFDVETRLASQYRDNFGPIKVPEGHYFVMGDNRDESLDSRYIGAVPEEMVSGTPMFIFLPWNRRSAIH